MVEICWIKVIIKATSNTFVHLLVLVSCVHLINAGCMGPLKLIFFVVTGLGPGRSRIRVPSGKDIFTSPERPYRPWSVSSLNCNGYRFYFSGGKSARA